jgi:hypothetical protein
LQLPVKILFSLELVDGDEAMPAHNLGNKRLVGKILRTNDLSWRPAVKSAPDLGMEAVCFSLTDNWCSLRITPFGAFEISQ